MLTRTWRMGIAAALIAGAAMGTAQAQAQPLRKAARMDHGIAAPSNGAGALPRQAAVPATVRILAVMVEFQSDGDARSSGTGKFGTVYPYDLGAEIIDPYPHDRAYFRAHLRFLENYIRKCSGGKTTAAGTVLDSVITVSKPIREYTFLKGGAEKPVADLAVEAWTLADRKFPGVDFSQYDMFVVFHAGRGRDVDLASISGSDPTPFDIPSLSFTLNSFRRHYGSAYAGIPVDGGAFAITNSSIVPCTDTREIPMITGQTGLLELSINGLLAASFGTYAGLPDLFNTARGTTGIGRFGLMDAESIFAFGGVCPPAPSAWEKQFLGWTSPREAFAGKRNYFLTAYRTDQPSTADIISVPITGSEYWLIENRQRDPGNNGQRVTMVSGGQDLELAFSKDTTGFTTDNITSLKGVVVDVEDVDWSIPGGTVVSNTDEIRVGGGILIWHIDETIIAAGLVGNTVNADPDRRGVDLEQAGGPQDIGKTITSLLGSSIGTGSPLDYWFRGNISPLYTNSFGVLTTPNTRANNGAYTHVTVDNFGEAGPVMDLDIAIGDNTIAPMAGFPVDLRGPLDANQTDLRIQTADLDGDGADELLVLAGWSPQPGISGPVWVKPAFLFAYKQDGTPLLSGVLPTFFNSISRVLLPPLVGTLEGGSAPTIAVTGLGGGTVHIILLSSRDSNSNGQFDLIRDIEFPLSNLRAPGASFVMIESGRLCYLTAGAAGDTLHVLGTADVRIPLGGVAYSLASFRSAGLVWVEGIGVVDILAGSIVYPAATQGYPAHSARNTVVSDFDRNNAADIAQYHGALSLWLGQSGTVATFASRDIAAYASAPLLASADVDGDGRNDVLLADSSRVAAFNNALASVDYHPAPWGARSILAARIDGQKGDALFAVGDAQLSQLLTGARQADGFPVPLPQNASVCLMPIGSTNHTLGVAAAGSDQHLYLFNTANRITREDLVWKSMFGDERNGNFAAVPARAIASAPEFFPLDRCYNWPNPAYDKTTKIRYFVSKDAAVTIKIYDLAGGKVDELRATAIGGLDNEVDWNLSNIQTGVYLAHVSAEGGGMSGEKIIKIAVVK
jgi:hypothetical protein